MKIGIPKESAAGEKRVAASPKSVTALIKMETSSQIRLQMAMIITDILKY